MNFSTKTLRVMKLTVFFMLCGLACVKAEGFAQTFKVNLDLKEQTLEKAFALIEAQTDLVFFYSSNEVDVHGKITVSCHEADLEDALREILGKGYTFRIKDNIVLIHPAGQQARVAITIQGAVTDDKNVPIPGVNIRVKGTNIGTATDRQGAYKLAVPDMDKFSLVYSFIGMKSQEIAYVGKNVIDVVMKDEPAFLESVVVTGFQSIRTDENVGSISVLKGKDLPQDGVKTLEQMMQGKIPGVVITNTSGLVGGTQTKVRVRGTSTLLGNQEPVWVVDGIIQEDPLPFKAQEFDSFGAIQENNFDMIRNFIGNSISWLNPNDIEDITVLKDATATVMYGVKAANGVILITTKKGGDGGRISVKYNGTVAFSKHVGYGDLNLMNSKERIDVSREMYQKKLYGTRLEEKVGYEYSLSRYLNKEISFEEFNAEVKRLETVNTDWFDILYRNPVSQDHSVSMSGSSEIINYYASVNYSNVLGTAKGNDSESYGAKISLDAKFNQKLILSLQLYGNSAETHGFYQADPYSYALSTSRAIPCFEDNGDLFYYKTKVTNSSARNYNILNELANTGNVNDTRTIGTNFKLRYTVIDGLVFESTFAMSLSNAVGSTWASERSQYIATMRGYEYGEYNSNSIYYKSSRLPYGGELNSTEASQNTITWRNTLAYDKVWREKHRVNFFLGEEIRSNHKKGYNNTVYGYFPELGQNITLPSPVYVSGGINYPNTLYVNNMNPSVTNIKDNYVGVFGSASYSYNERYVIMGSVRYDASNRFGQDTRHRFLPVWSTGLRWNIHNEAWMQNQNIISMFDFRASYGWQGNVLQNYGPDFIAQRPSSPMNTYVDEFILETKSLGYADLRWEKTKTINLGVDLGFFRNRFNLSAEYYRKKTEDMIVSMIVPYEYGINSMPINGGNMYNSGIEVQVSGTMVQSRNFVWNLTLNTSKNLNRLESTLADELLWGNAVNGALYKKGYAVSSFWAFDYLGPDPETGIPVFWVPDANTPGVLTDVTKSMKYMGKLDPDFSAGLSTNLRYKMFTLSGSFNLQVGGKKFLYQMFGPAMQTSVPSGYENLPKEFVDRWRQPGDEKFTSIPTIPSITADGKYHIQEFPTIQYGYTWMLYNYCTDRVVNASFLRCNSLSLTYNLPENIVSKLNMTNLTLTLSVSNPFIIVSSDFKGMDPEVATGKQPIVKTWSLGINLGF